jgi:hypothetical protein
LPLSARSGRRDAILRDGRRANPTFELASRRPLLKTAGADMPAAQPRLRQRRPHWPDDVTDGRMSAQDISQLDAQADSETRSNIRGAGLAVISSLGLFWLVIFEFGFANYARSVGGSLGVVTGYPFWKTFQDRVLAPYIIKALSFGSLDHYFAAHIFFHIVTVAIVAFLCWRLGRKYGGDDRSALFALAIFVFSFVVLLRPPWLYSWDFIDMIVFALFVDFVLSGRSLPWFIGLFAVAIWNRDSAQIIALWLILDAMVRFVYRHYHGLPKATLDWRRILAGVICIGAGLLISELLRRSLLVEEMGPRLFPHSPFIAGPSYHLGLWVNAVYLEHSLFTAKALIVVTFLAMTVWLGAMFARLDPQRHLSIFLAELAMLAALLVFGLLNEPRIFLILIPFVVNSAVFVLRRNHGALAPA